MLQFTKFEELQKKIGIGDSSLVSFPSRNINSILEVIEWEIDLGLEKLNLIGSSHGYNNISTTNLCLFFKAIKESFRDYFIELIQTSISMHFFNVQKQFKHVQLHFMVPFKLNRNRYDFVSLYVVPVYTKNRLYKLQLVLIPLCGYNNEPLAFRVILNRKENTQLTNQIKALVKPPNPFTKKQMEIVKLSKCSLTADDLARKMNTSKWNINKLNRRIFEKLSELFEIKFLSTQEAIAYYKKCFECDNVRDTRLNNTTSSKQYE